MEQPVPDTQQVDDAYAQTLALKQRFEERCPQTSALKGVWYVSRKTTTGEWVPLVEFREASGGVMLYSRGDQWQLTNQALVMQGRALLQLSDADPALDNKLLNELQQHASPSGSSHE